MVLKKEALIVDELAKGIKYLEVGPPSCDFGLVGIEYVAGLLCRRQ
jgi:hypothetical protein